MMNIKLAARNKLRKVLLSTFDVLQFTSANTTPFEMKLLIQEQIKSY